MWKVMFAANCMRARISASMGNILGVGKGAGDRNPALDHVWEVFASGRVAVDPPCIPSDMPISIPLTSTA